MTSAYQNAHMEMVRICQTQGPAESVYHEIFIDPCIWVTQIPPIEKAQKGVRMKGNE